MPWDRDPLEALDHVLDNLDTIVEQELADGADDLAAVLAAGTPIDTGEMANSWEVDQIDLLVFEVAPQVEYGDEVAVDTTGVPLIIADINQSIGDAVSGLIEEA